MTQKFYIKTNTQRRMLLQFPDPALLPNVDLDLELSLHNYPIAMEVLLHGLIRGTPATRTKILSNLQRQSSWPLFDEYLFSALLQTLKQNSHAQITDEYIFQRVASFGPEMYGEPLSRRDVRGILSNTAHALYLHPKPRHVEEAILILRQSVAREKKGQNSCGTMIAKARTIRRAKLSGRSGDLPERKRRA